MNGLRIFFVGSWTVFRALFNFHHPAVFVPTMLLGPVAQLIFFTYLGRYTGLGDDTFFVVGNAVQASSIAGLYATIMLIANERQFQSLGGLLVTPASRFIMFCGRTIPPAVTGVLVSSFVLLVGSTLFGLHVPLASVPAILVAVGLTSLSCAMLGLAAGAIAVRTGDLWIGSNLIFNLTLLLCGVNVPQDALPNWLGVVGDILPLTHGIEAVRGLYAGQGLGDVAGLLGTEALVGGCYGVLGFVLLKVFEAESRRRATLASI